MVAHMTASSSLDGDLDIVDERKKLEPRHSERFPKSIHMLDVQVDALGLEALDRTPAKAGAHCKHLLGPAPFHPLDPDLGRHCGAYS